MHIKLYRSSSIKKSLMLSGFWRKNLWFFLLYIISFIITAFGEPSRIPLLAPLAAVLGYALVWRVILEFPSKIHRFLIATLWFSFVYAIQISWMSTTTFVGPFIVILFVLVSLSVGIQFGLTSLLIIPGKALLLRRIFLIASVWVLMEYVRNFALSGFPWNPVGIALASWNLSSQMVSIFGIYGLSFIVMITNLLTLRLLIQKNEWKFRAAWSALVLLPYAFGFFWLSAHETLEKRDNRFLSALLVQTAILPDQKTYREEKTLSSLDQWNKILQMLASYKDEKVDLIVFPEGAVPHTADAPAYYFSELQQSFYNHLGADTLKLLPALESPLAFLYQTKKGEGFWAVSNRYWAKALANVFSADVIIGLQALDKSEGKVISFQSAFYVRPNLLTHERYDKRILVPVGEYIPFEWSREIAKHFGIYDSFSCGSTAKVFQGTAPVGLSICYEEIYGHLMRENRLLGASCLVNVTNDGWYPNSKLPEQHFNHSRLRAIENGVPVLRACNTGVTAAVDSLGRITKHIPIEKELVAEVLFVKVPLYSYRTLYTYVGDYLILAISLFFILSFLHKNKYTRYA